MKQIKIDEQLFIDLCKYHLLDLAPDYGVSLEHSIASRLQKKLDAVTDRLQRQQEYLAVRRSNFSVFTEEDLPF